MSFADFNAYFDDIYVCRIFTRARDGGTWYKYAVDGEWKGQTAGGPISKSDTSQWNPQYYLKPTKPSRLFVSLRVVDDVASMGGMPCGIIARVLKKGGARAKAMLAGEPMFATLCARDVEVGAEGALDPVATFYTLFVGTSEVGAELRFRVTVYSDAPLDMVDAVGAAGGAAAADGGSDMDGVLRLIPTTVPAK